MGKRRQAGVLIHKQREWNSILQTQTLDLQFAVRQAQHLLLVRQADNPRRTLRATAAAATLPMVSRAEDRPPPATALMPYFASYVASAWEGRYATDIVS